MTKTVKKSVAFLSAAVMFMAMLLYFPGGTFSNIDWGLKASAATAITPSQPTGDGSVGSPYQIGTAAELYWFAAQVNSGSTTINAVLTANITVNTGVLNTNGSFTSWTPIGNYDNQYTGTFNGNGKTISGLYFDDGNTNYVGLFGCVGSGGNVSNVGIVDSYFNGKQSVGGVCGENYGTIKNCYNTGAVSGNGYYAGGVCGNNYNSTIQNCYNTGAVSGQWKVGGVCGENYNSTIQNCYSTGTVSGWDKIGGVCGYNDGSTITNCYFDSDNYSGGAGHIYSGTITNVEGKTTTQFESGEVCYLLQSGQENDSESGKAPMVWGQTIGTDKAPVLTSDSKKTVYLIGGTYSNTNSEITEYEAPELNGNVYEITNASQLYWFAEYVKRGNTSAEAILKNNIVVNENVLVENGNLVGDTSNFVSWTPIGNSLKQYTGTFNGNGKTISGLYFDDSGTDYVGLFGYVGSSGNVSNVGVVASYFKGKNNVGGVCGNNNGTIKNCYNTGAVNGSENVGGVCGYNYGTIQNCYSTGAVSGSNNVGGVCGNNNGTIKNCYNTGVVSGSDNVGGVCGYNNGGTITNCYFDSNNYGGGAVGSTDGGTITDVEGKTTNAFEKGEVCYLLQSGQEKDSESEEAPMVWGQTIDGQTIDIDKAPVLTSDSAKTVYPKTTGCVASYSNTNSEITEKEHSNPGADFRCPDCGNYVAPKLNEDVYEITNASQLYWFAKYVNKGNTSANAILKENIVVNENVLDEAGNLVGDTSNFVSWTPIGSESKQYTGTFDGNGKTISGLYFDNNGTDYVGLFGYVGSDGNVSNVGVVASYFSGSYYVGGVCGRNYGTIKNCYNTGAVSGSYYVGGVCGFNSKSGNATITNCYNTGAVSGSDFLGGVCGHNYGTIKNCYYLTGTATGGIYGADVTGSAESKTAAQFNSGEVAYLLNGSTSEGMLVWGQDLSTTTNYPVLGGANVYQTLGCVGYSNTENETKAHTPVSANNGVPATCGTAGKEADTVCSDCGETLTEGATIPATGLHTAPDTYDNGFGTCTACNNEVYQPATQNASGIYEISNAGQLYWFAQQVNSGNTGINAELTANITVNTGVLKPDGTLADNASEFRSWTPIGNDSNKYTGTFDGKGKTVSGLYFNETNTDYVGLFGYSNGTIKNVGVVDSYFKGNQCVGGVCGNGTGLITNCYNTATVNGTTFIGGVCGHNSFCVVANCYNTGKVTGDSIIGNVCGEDGSYCITQNCYYLADTADENGGKTAAQFASGEVAYLLSKGCTANTNTYSGDVWGQDLSAENSYPVLGGAKVYQNLTYAGCEGKPGEPVKTEYSNTQLDPVYADHTDGDEDGKCDTCSKYMDNIGARLVGHSLTLDGSVGVNFYMELSSEVISDSSAYMEFTLPGGKTSTVKVSEAPTEVISGTTYYKFKCQVNATAMTDTITAQIKSTVGNSKVYEYTVKEYADYLFAHKDESTEFAEAAELIEAMVNYGSYAQIYAGYNTEKLAVGDAKNLKSLDDVWITAYYEPSIYETKVQFAGANLSLLSTTTLRMYFQLIDVEANEVRFGYQGQLLEMKQSGDYYYVELVGIPASKLDDEFRIDVLEGSTNFVVTYTPMAYCTSVVTRPTTETRTESLKNLIKALVLYNRAADAYISEN